MIQTQEIGKKPSFRPGLGPLGTNLGKNQFSGPLWPAMTKIPPPKKISWVLLLLDVRHCRKLSLYGKRMIQNEENGKKPHFGPRLGSLGPNSGCRFLLLKKLPWPITRYHGQLSSCKISEKMIQSLENFVTDRQRDRRADRGE